MSKFKSLDGILQSAISFVAEDEALKKLLVLLPASREPSALGGINTLPSKAIKH